MYISTTIHFYDDLDISQTAAFYKNYIPYPGNLVKDTSCHFHLASWNGSAIDSIQNPFNLTSHANAYLKLNANKAFVEFLTFPFNNRLTKFCPATYSNFRNAFIEEGSFIKYRDTFLI